MEEKTKQQLTNIDHGDLKKTLQQLQSEKIAVLMGGESNEADISRLSAEAIYEHLSKLKLKVKKLAATKDVIDQLKKEDFTLVYNALHGRLGEDGILQANLEFNKIAYTGEDFLSSAICFHKIRTKNILNANFIKTPKYYTFEDSLEINNIKDILAIKKMNFPVVLKLISSGSSIGVEMVKSENALMKKLKELKNKKKLVNYYLEQKIIGREVTVGMYHYKGRQVILPIIEIKAKKEFYDFEAKYTPGMTEMIIPAELSKSLKIIIDKTVKKLFAIFAFRECVRIDFMIDKEEVPYVLEINTSPGMTDTSDIPKMLEKAGIPIEQFLVENLYQAKKQILKS